MDDRPTSSIVHQMVMDAMETAKEHAENALSAVQDDLSRLRDSVQKVEHETASEIEAIKQEQVKSQTGYCLVQ